MPIRSHVEMEITGFNATKPSNKYGLVRVDLQMGGSYCRIAAVVVKEMGITIRTPGLVNISKQLGRQGVKLADRFVSDDVGDIDLIIGGDNYHKLVKGQHKFKGVSLLSTPGGCMIVGPIKNHVASSKETVDQITVFGTSVIDDLVEIQDEQLNTVKNLWELDTIGIPDHGIAVDDMATQNQYISSVKYDGTRYWVRLPMKENRPILPSNRGPAQAQMVHLCHKLGGEADMLQVYDKVISQLKELDFIEEVPPPSSEQEVHYLPHHGVKKDSVSTPLRIVFNASSKTRGKPSLNDCLMKGPNLTEKLVKKGKN